MPIKRCGAGTIGSFCLYSWHLQELAALPQCPAANSAYQLFRQQALAEGIAQSGMYDLVVSNVAVDTTGTSPWTPRFSGTASVGH